MKVVHKEFMIKLGAEGDMKDITQKVREIVRESNIKNGLVNIFAVGSTAAVTTIEYESGLVGDFKTLMERLAPKDAEYKHNLRWGDYNGHSHVRASIVKPNIVVPVVDGDLVLGVWQQIVIINFDNRVRERRVIVTCVGD